MSDVVVGRRYLSDTSRSIYKEREIVVEATRLKVVIEPVEYEIIGSVDVRRYSLRQFLAVKKMNPVDGQKAIDSGSRRDVNNGGGVANDPFDAERMQETGGSNDRSIGVDAEPLFRLDSCDDVAQAAAKFNDDVRVQGIGEIDDDFLVGPVGVVRPAVPFVETEAKS